MRLLIINVNILNFIINIKKNKLIKKFNLIIEIIKIKKFFNKIYKKKRFNKKTKFSIIVIVDKIKKILFWAKFIFILRSFLRISSLLDNLFKNFKFFQRIITLFIFFFLLFLIFFYFSFIFFKIDNYFISQFFAIWYYIRKFFNDYIINQKKKKLFKILTKNDFKFISFLSNFSSFSLEWYINLYFIYKHEIFYCYKYSLINKSSYLIYFKL